MIFRKIVKNNLFFAKKMSGFGHKLYTIMDYYGINKEKSSSLSREDGAVQ